MTPEQINDIEQAIENNFCNYLRNGTDATEGVINSLKENVMQTVRSIAARYPIIDIEQRRMTKDEEQVMTEFTNKKFKDIDIKHDPIQEMHDEGLSASDLIGGDP